VGSASYTRTTAAPGEEMSFNTLSVAWRLRLILNFLSVPLWSVGNFGGHSTVRSSVEQFRQCLDAQRDRRHLLRNGSVFSLQGAVERSILCEWRERPHRSVSCNFSSRRQSSSNGLVPITARVDS